MLAVVAASDARENEMSRIEAIAGTAMTLTVFCASYGVLAAVLYTML